MNILFWILFIIEGVCIVSYIIASKNRNYRRCGVIETVAYLVIALLLVMAVLGNKGLIAW